jgi:hypothetical protein
MDTKRGLAIYAIVVIGSAVISFGIGLTMVYMR